MNLSIERKQVSPFPAGIFCLILSVGLLFSACSFDYGSTDGSDKSKPDIVMENLEYVRVRGGDPLARFQAEHAERWEERQTMELREFSFEQMEDHGETVNAEGRAGFAVVQLGSGDISLKGGVRIRVDSEDVTIRTAELEWKDKAKTLSGGDRDIVDIQRSDGTSFTGRGFFADARNRLWAFSGEVKGTYVEKEDEEGEGDESKSAEAGVERYIQTELKEGTGQSFPSREESYPVTEQPASPAEQIPGPAQVIEPKPSIPEPAVAPEPKPSIPEPAVAPEPKPSIPVPEYYPEPKPSIPAPDVYLPILPEDK